jgi:hypothetical protein
MIFIIILKRKINNLRCFSAPLTERLVPCNPDQIIFCVFILPRFSQLQKL